VVARLAQEQPRYKGIVDFTTLPAADTDPCRASPIESSECTTFFNFRIHSTAFKSSGRLKPLYKAARQNT
jgi:hypothetical protein